MMPDIRAGTAVAVAKWSRQRPGDAGDARRAHHPRAVDTGDANAPELRSQPAAQADDLPPGTDRCTQREPHAAEAKQVVGAGPRHLRRDSQSCLRNHSEPFGRCLHRVEREHQRDTDHRGQADTLERHLRR
jgi:hypothetical protein